MDWKEDKLLASIRQRLIADIGLMNAAPPRLPSTNIVIVKPGREAALFIRRTSRRRIDVCALALRGRAVGEGCAGRADQDAAGGRDHRPFAYCRRTAVAKRRGVE